jgi:tetratricopeptide (TPR) repeat protein
VGDLGPRSDSGPPRTPIDNFITEGDLFASYGQLHKAVEQYQKVFEIDPNHLESHQKILEMYDKLGEFEPAAQACLNLYALHTGRGEVEEAGRYYERARRYNPDIDYAAARPAEDTGQVKVQKMASPEVLQGLLEEVDFYLDQNFLSEARKCIKQFQEIAPLDPQLESRLKRLEALARKESHGAAPSAPEEPEEVHLNVEEFETSAPAVVTGSVPGGAPSLPGFEITSRPETPIPSKTSQPAETSFAELMTGMDDELRETIQTEPLEPPLTPESKPVKGERAGLDDIFEAFKAEFDEDESEAVDYETHYNLGTAYKEMGLLEEGISEFQKALQDKELEKTSDNFVRCVNMLGLCFMEKGLPQVAIKWFKNGLSSPGHSEETYQALRYDLGCAHELSGDKKAALETFLDIYGLNINYRDVAEKIEALKKFL